VADYDKVNPGQSTRQAADDLGISKSEVSRGRQSPVPPGTPQATVTGRDSKTYPASKMAKPGAEPEPERSSPEVERFDLHVTNLLQVIEDREERHFKKTGISQVDLMQLGSFLMKVALKKSIIFGFPQKEETVQ
jgi:hypothetical protein